MLYIWARGKYKNLDHSKTFQIDQVYYFNLNTKTFGTMIGPTRNSIIETVRKNEKNK